MSSNNYLFNNTLLEDFTEVAKSNVDWHIFKGKSFLITGANGFIASVLIKFLLFLSEEMNLNIHIIALMNNYEKGLSIFGEKLIKRLEVIQQDIRNPIEYQGSIDYIIHFASITSSKKMISNPVDTIDVSVLGATNVFKLALRKQIESMIYVSSMEVYGTCNDADIVDETKLGHIDNLSVRSDYPESKRLCENMSVAYFTQYNLPVKIARLSQTFGAGVLPGDNRIFIQIAKSVISSKPIILHTAGRSEGNYCYISDCVLALLILLVRGMNGNAYNIVNEDNHTTIKDMAELISSELGNGKCDVCYELLDNRITGYAQDTKLKLSAKKMMNLGWEPKVNLLESYKRMIKYIKEEDLFNE